MTGLFREGGFEVVKRDCIVVFLFLFFFFLLILIRVFHFSPSNRFVLRVAVQSGRTWGCAAPSKRFALSHLHSP